MEGFPTIHQHKFFSNKGKALHWWSLEKIAPFVKSLNSFNFRGHIAKECFSLIFSSKSNKSNNYDFNKRHNTYMDTVYLLSLILYSQHLKQSAQTQYNCFINYVMLSLIIKVQQKHSVICLSYCSSLTA